MKLVDMIETPEERKAEGGITASPVSVEDDKPHYPYGLQLSLDDANMKKLGMKMPKIGEEFYGCFMARVTHVHESASEDSESRNASLQIVHLAIGDEDEAEEGVEAEPMPPPKKNKILRRY